MNDFSHNSADTGHNIPFFETVPHFLRLFFAFVFGTDHEEVQYPKHSNDHQNTFHFDSSPFISFSGLHIFFTPDSEFFTPDGEFPAFPEQTMFSGHLSARPGQMPHHYNRPCAICKFFLTPLCQSVFPHSITGVSRSITGVFSQPDGKFCNITRPEGVKSSIVQRVPDMCHQAVVKIQVVQNRQTQGQNFPCLEQMPQICP